MEKKYTILRVHDETRKQLRILAALQNESMLRTLERLVEQEYRRVLQQGGQQHAADEKDQA
jgi:copper homeostasis protein CutC